MGASGPPHPVVVLDGAGEPRSSCCIEQVSFYRTYTDTHRFDFRYGDDTAEQHDGITWIPVRFTKTYDAGDPDDAWIECNKCGSHLEDENVEVEQQ